LKFTITSKEHSDLIEDLREKRLDLVISNRLAKRRHPDFEFEFPVYLVTSRDQNEFKHLSEAKIDTILQVLQESLVLPSEGLVFREELDAFLGRIRSQPTVIFESSILACIVRAIREKVGCGFLPLPYIWQEYKKGNLSIVGPSRGFWRHKIYFFAAAEADELLVKNLAQLISDYEGVAVS
jgi:DNA-binding transcriptional LysR family regulator